MNFEQYFFREFLEEPFQNPMKKMDDKIMSTKLGSHHHQSTSRITQIGNRKKGLHLIAKSQSQKKKSLHPMVDHIIATRPTAPKPIAKPVALIIMQAYDRYPNENKKVLALARTGVSIHYVNPELYMLSYTGEGKGKDDGTIKISK